jgi:ABC-type xylose transport system permease subunit
MSSTLPEATPKKEGRQAARLSLKGFDYQEYALVGVVVLILIVGGILESSFLTEDNMLNVLR